MTNDEFREKYEYDISYPIKCSDGETYPCAIYTKQENNCVDYEILFSSIGFKGEEDISCKFMYIDTYADTFKAYKNLDDVKNYMDDQSYKKFANIPLEYYEEMTSQEYYQAQMKVFDEKIEQLENERMGLPILFSRRQKRKINNRINELKTKRDTFMMS